MRGVRWSVGAAVGVVLIVLNATACEFPECGSESDPNNYPGGFCMGSPGQSSAGASAPVTSSSPQQALIGFRPHPQYGGIVPAWLFANNLGTFDIDALVDGTTPNDSWRWSSDGSTAVYEQNGIVGQFQDIVQLYAPARDQRLDGTYELVDYDDSVQLLRFDRDGSLTVCSAARGLPVREHYTINGFVFDWQRESGAIERHAILYDPSDASQIWIGSRQLVQARAGLCVP